MNSCYEKLTSLEHPSHFSLVRTWRHEVPAAERRKKIVEGQAIRQVQRRQPQSQARSISVQEISTAASGTTAPVGSPTKP